MHSVFGVISVVDKGLLETFDTNWCAGLYNYPCERKPFTFARMRDDRPRSIDNNKKTQQLLTPLTEIIGAGNRFTSSMYSAVSDKMRCATCKATASEFGV